MVLLHAGAHLAAAILLLSGSAKLRNPDATRPALRALRLPASRSAAVALGAAEVLVAVAALLTDHTAAFVALAVLWCLLTAVAALLARAGSTDCGCFGTSDVPISWSHVALNALVASIAVVAAVDPPSAVPTVLDADLLVEGLPYVALLAAGAAAVAAVLTTSPARAPARSRP